MAKSLTPLRAQRRQKILEAAEGLFVTYGVRATTMEGLATAVGMSKVTVYSYFEDKDAVFAAVSDRVAHRMEQVFLAQLEADGPAPLRVANALIAKHNLIHNLVRNSPHAEELFSAKSRTSAERFRTLDAQMTARIADVIAPTTDEPERLAALLFDASQGIANGARDFATVESNIRSLMKVIETAPEQSH